MSAGVHDGIADELSKQYGDWLRTWSPSPKTAKVRQALAHQVLEAWGLRGLTPENIQTWLGTSDFRPWTRSTYHAHLIDFCKWLVAMGYLKENPMDGVRKPKRPTSVPKPLTDVEVERALATAEPVVREWLQLALLAGLRAHEIAKIRGEDVTQVRLYVEGKGQVLAALPTHPDIWAIAEKHATNGYWYPGTEDGHITGNHVSVAVGKHFRSLGITGSIHRARHTYATRLLRDGQNIRVVQRLMRHASLATTQVYTAVSDDELAAAIGRLQA